MDRILPFFDPPPCVDSFYTLSVDKNRHFLTPSHPSSCPRSYWMSPNISLEIMASFCNFLIRKKRTLIQNWNLALKNCQKESLIYTMGIIMFFNTMFLMTFYRYKHFKGQLISKCPFDVIVSTKIPTKKILRISALASKKRSNQKNKGTFYR